LIDGKRALGLAPESFTAHDELARRAEERDELPTRAPPAARRCFL
jgi:hypothetical protein